MKRSRRKVALALTAALATVIGLVPATGAFAAAGYPNPAPTDPADVAFAAGAYVIDAGAVTGSPAVQTVARGVKPYGLVYALVQARIPVQWVIDPTKAAIDQTKGNDATDFAYDCDGGGAGASKNYKTGAFIIEKQFAKAAKTIIDAWKTKGVVVDGPCAAATPTLPVFATIRSWPRTVINTSNSSIATNFFAAAEIPQGAAGDPLHPQAYRTALPDELTSCDDVFAMPHADPTYADHNKLIGFVKGGGSIWAGCHAVSVLESITYPSGDDAGKLAMNFLTTNGLLNYKSPGHAAGSTPYAFFKQSGDATAYYPSDYTLESVRSGDPIAQFLGRTDEAHTNGSEQIYMPAAGSKWRSTTQVVEYDPTQADVTSNSPGPAAVLVYGPAYGDSNNGLVMYEAGHDIYKATGAANVAALRAFFNLLLLSAVGGAGGVPKAPQVAVTAPAADASFTAGDEVTVTGNATGGSGSNTYSWGSECFDSSAVAVGGGTFADGSVASTTFTAPAVPSLSTCNLTLTVIDSCGHVSFATQTISVAPAPDTLDIEVEKTAPSKVLLGSDFAYTLKVTNHGAKPGTTSGDGLVASAVSLSDTLPAGLTFVSVSTPTYTGTAPTGAGCVASGDPVTVTCDLKDMEDEQTATITLTVNISEAVVGVKNTATVTTSGKESYKANNTDDVKTSVTLPPTGGGTDLVFVAALLAVGLGGLVLAGSRRRRTA